jgi:hypothetical protein
MTALILALADTGMRCLGGRPLAGVAEWSLAGLGSGALAGVVYGPRLLFARPRNGRALAAAGALLGMSFGAMAGLMNGLFGDNSAAWLGAPVLGLVVMVAAAVRGAATARLAKAQER